MLAVVTTGHGGPERLEVREVADPEPGPGEARVAVAATSVNNTDLWSREGAYGSADDPDAVAGWRGVPLDFPRVQGADVVGTVDAVGDGVDAGWIGRRVLVDNALYRDAVPDGDPHAGEAADDAGIAGILGSERDGSYAQYCVVHAARLHDVGESPLDDAALAALPTAYGTALGMLRRAGVGASDRLLVTGASGGVGIAAVGLASALGCDVVALTSATTADAVREAGARATVDRSRGDVAAQVREATDRLDVVVDVVGGPLFRLWPSLLAPRGRVVVAGAVAGPIVEIDLRRLYLNQQQILGSTMHTPAIFRDLAGLAVRGDLRVPVAARYPLTEVREAQRAFREDSLVGKVVLDVPR
jgi:NADPH:quinone reductase-like Zn-dependent oxidoreductase